MTARASSVPRAPRRLASSRWRPIAVAAVVLVALTPVLAAVHLSEVPHSFSAGRLVHCGQRDPGAPGGQNSREAPPSGSSRAECQVFAVVHQASGVPEPPPCVTAPPEVSGPTPVLREPAPMAAAWALYLLAPAHSPPGSRA